MMSKEAMARMARRIVRMSNEIVYTPLLEKRHKQKAEDILSLVRDMASGKVGGIPLDEQRRTFNKYTYNARSVVNMIRSFLMDGEEAIREEKLSSAILDNVIKVRDQAIIKLMSTKKYDLYAHSKSELDEVRWIRNQLGDIKRKLDIQISAMKKHLRL